MDTKSLLTSKTFWGTVVQIAAMAAMFLKIDIGDQGGWVEAIVGVVGAAVTIYGRIVAIKKIG
ncbi:MAG TPA: hypothetical protein VN444_04555 [Verrucomicrobiae bacterium]|nr:hypothetical protein [Verrucomicrobiae bacterium]